MTPTPVILHLDMDAFFAAVEQRDFPELRGKPVLVGGGRGGTGKRGVVTTASYEARVFGCHSAMPMAQARRLCPQAIVQPVRMSVYAQASDAVMDALRELSPTVQPVSIDEAFADLAPVLHLHGCPAGADDAARYACARAIAAELKDLVRKRVNLPCSVGIAHSKSLAKTASDYSKPDGLHVVLPAQSLDFLAPMKAGVLYTLGPKAQARLASAGVRTVRDLREKGLAWLESEFGESGTFWWELAHARDVRPVNSQRDDAKSISRDSTFSDDISDPGQLRTILARHVEDVAKRLRAEKFLARRVSIKCRTPDFRTFTRAVTLEAPTDQTLAILHAADGLLSTFLASGKRSLRLLGVTLSEFVQHTQPGLFEPPPAVAKVSRADAVLDSISERFGKGVIARGSSLAEPVKKVSDSDQSPKISRTRKL